MKSKGIVVVIFVLGVLVFFWGRGRKLGLEKIVKVEKLNVVDAKLYFHFVSGKESWVAKMGDIFVTNEDLILDKNYGVLKKKETDLELALLYLQFISYSDPIVSEILIYSDSDEVQFKSLLNQLGFPIQPETQIRFAKKADEELLASIGEKNILKSEVKKDHYLWGALQTEFFNWKLSTIDKIIKNKTLVIEAKKVNKNVQDYRHEYINQYLKQEASKEALEAFRIENGFEKTKEGFLLTEKYFKESFEKKGLNYFLEKYVLVLPIQVNLLKPMYRPNLGMDYVATKGPKLSELQITLFTDSLSQSSHELLKNLNILDKEYSGLSIHYRPILSGNNSFQDLREKINFCVLQDSGESFWTFLSISQGFFNEKTQEILFEKANELGYDLAKLEVCLRDDLTEKVITYQKKYAAYIGVQSGPVVFINGEVLTPPVAIDQLIKVINRQLEFADAAIW